MSPRRLNPTSLILLSIASGIFLAACGQKYLVLPIKHTRENTQNNTVNNNQTVVVPNPPPAVHRDRIIFGVPSGEVDILFVVDNTGTAGDRRPIPGLHNQNLLTWFQASYTQLANHLADPNARELGYRMQIASTPGRANLGATLPRSHIHRDMGDPRPHYQEIFGHGLLPYGQFLFGQEEHGNTLTPFAATHAALESHPFSERSHIPLFLVYLLGNDSADVESERSAALQTTLNSASRGSHQTHAFVVSKANMGYSAHCLYTHPRHTLEQMAALQNQSINLTQIDLCNLGPENTHLGTKIYNAIVDQMGGGANQRRYTLSRIPLRPELMTVRHSGHIFRYGTEYTYDQVSNSIQFTPAANVQIRDIIEIDYHVTVPAGLLPGGGPGELPPDNQGDDHPAE